MGAFERLGIADRIASLPCVKKLGAQILTGDGSRSVEIYFRNALGARWDHAYHVVRADFDKLLLDRAREAGVEVREGCAVESVALGGSVSKVGVSGPEGTEDLTCRFVIDSSGRSAFIGSRLGHCKPYEGLRKLSVFAHFEGVRREEGERGTMIRLIRGRDCWFWLIPLTDQRTSVGVVLDAAFYTRCGFRSPEDCLDTLAARHTAARDCLIGARRLTPVHSTGDYSYEMRRMAGPGWIAAGDAAGFVDPIFSTGVFLALHSGERAARAVDAFLSNGRSTPFAAYERDVRRVIRLYLGFVRRWYEPQFIEMAQSPERLLGVSAAVNAVLSGDIGRRFSVRWRLWCFYLVLWLQKWIPIAPRLDAAIAPSAEPASEQPLAA